MGMTIYNPSANDVNPYCQPPSASQTTRARPNMRQSPMIPMSPITVGSSTIPPPYEIRSAYGVADGRCRTQNEELDDVPPRRYNSPFISCYPNPDRSPSSEMTILPRPGSPYKRQHAPPEPDMTKWATGRVPARDEPPSYSSVAGAMPSYMSEGARAMQEAVSRPLQSSSAKWPFRERPTDHGRHYEDDKHGDNKPEDKGVGRDDASEMRKFPSGLSAKDTHVLSHQPSSSCGRVPRLEDLVKRSVAADCNGNQGRDCHVGPGADAGAGADRPLRDGPSLDSAFITPLSDDECIRRYLVTCGRSGVELAATPSQSTPGRWSSRLGYRTVYRSAPEVDVEAKTTSGVAAEENAVEENAVEAVATDDAAAEDAAAEDATAEDVAAEDNAAEGAASEDAIAEDATAEDAAAEDAAAGYATAEDAAVERAAAEDNAAEDNASEGAATEDNAAEDAASEDAIAEDAAAEDAAAEDAAAESAAAEENAAEGAASEDAIAEDAAAEDAAAEDAAGEGAIAEDNAGEGVAAEDNATPGLVEDDDSGWDFLTEKPTAQGDTDQNAVGIVSATIAEEDENAAGDWVVLEGGW